MPLPLARSLGTSRFQRAGRNPSADFCEHRYPPRGPDILSFADELVSLECTAAVLDRASLGALHRPRRRRHAPRPGASRRALYHGHAVRRGALRRRPCGNERPARGRGRALT